VSPGALYTALDRLETRGLVASRLGEPPPQRGGKRTRLYTLQPAGQRARAQAYETLRQMALGFLFVRTTPAPATIVPQIRAAVEALDPNLPLIDVKTTEMRFGEATWRQRSSAWLLGIFAMLALSATGVYAVMSQSVEQRRREIGVRLALGAARRDILQLAIGRVAAIAAIGIGIGIGLVLAVPTMPLLSTLLYRATPGDPSVRAAGAGAPRGDARRRRPWRSSWATRC
jgi:DNA-binding PadR family transcriptional regulator